MADDSSQRSTGERLGLAALLLIASQLLSRILGMIRDTTIGVLHGSGLETDAYELAFQLPDYLFYLIGGGTLSVSFIPLFSEYLNNDNEEEGWKLFSTIATVLTLLMAVGITILEIFTPTFVAEFVARGVESQEKMDLTVSMTRILLFTQISFVIGGLIQATLYVREVFWPAAVQPLVYNICIISGGVLLNSWLGIKGFAVGALVGSILGPLGMTLIAARKHIVYQPRLDIYHEGFKRFLYLAAPLMVGASLVRVDQWIIGVLGSYHEQGAVTWLKRGRKLMMVFVSMIGQAVGQAALPFLANLVEQGKADEMGELLSRNLQHVVFAGAVATSGILVIAKPMTYLILQYGEFTPFDADMTAFFLVLFALGLVAWVSQQVAVRGFYAREDTFTPMLISTATVIISGGIYLGLDYAYGPAGLAAATSFGMALTAITTIAVYRYKYKPLPLANVFEGLARGIGFAAICGGVAFVIRMYLQPYVSITNEFENLLMMIVMGVGFFGAAGLLIAMFDPPETRYVLKRLKQKLSRSS